MSFEAYLSLGSNLGNRTENIKGALEKLGALKGTEIVSISSFYETEPEGFKEQPSFINMAAKIETYLSPHELLENIKAIERKMGRVDSSRWGPRSIDIDIILYGDEVISEPGLSIPHKRVGERDFVLVPLSEIDGELVHPASGQKIREMISGNRGKVVKLEVVC
jgi:2-amino-4-hydroxy-6-hydroxymethyldihydropteridine diphosphokinase